MYIGNNKKIIPMVKPATSLPQYRKYTDHSAARHSHDITMVMPQRMKDFLNPMLATMRCADRAPRAAPNKYRDPIQDETLWSMGKGESGDKSFGRVGEVHVYVFPVPMLSRFDAKVTK
uniref:Uncharacterized protein n=1 Tax=Clastoptera arizonana TaxID=38151 RepID=A0A1B6EB84_9HEMI